MLTRRILVKNLALAAGGIAAAVAAVLPARALRAAELPRLSVKDPAAIALGYVEDANQTDVKKYPSYVKGSTCENCLQLQGNAGATYRPCSLFPGKTVCAAGWCSAWSAEI